MLAMIPKRRSLRVIPWRESWRTDSTTNQDGSSMTADMHEIKFVWTLEGLPPFQQSGPVDEDVRAIPFPAWRALFSSLILLGHSTGYRLPSFDAFFAYCEKAYTHSEQNRRF